MPLMAGALRKLGIEVDVATTDDDGPGQRTHVAAGPHVREDGHRVFYFPKQTEFYKVSLPLREWLRENVQNYDVVHAHALFSFSSLAAARMARMKQVPYVIRPLGVLNRWGMENRRRWLKALSFRLLELPMLRSAAAMHYTSRMELEEASRFGLSCLQRVIPIGVDLTPFAQLPLASVFAQRHPEVAGTRNLLFLSRIDVKKGIDLLIAAFARLSPRENNLRLIICGDGDAALVASLKQQSADAGVAGDITWAGQVGGEQRLAAFASAELFVLPSHSENFGIALLEAMAAGLPCISTDQVALAVDAAAHAAVKIAAREPAAIAEAIQSLLNAESERSAMSQAARRLAQEEYSLDAMGASLHQLYRDVLSSQS